MLLHALATSFPRSSSYTYPLFLLHITRTPIQLSQHFWLRTLSKPYNTYIAFGDHRDIIVSSSYAIEYGDQCKSSLCVLSYDSYVQSFPRAEGGYSGHAHTHRRNHHSLLHVVYFTRPLTHITYSTPRRQSPNSSFMCKCALPLLHLQISRVQPR